MMANVAGAEQRDQGEQERVFRALGDPTRRAILDALRRGPQTTGQLAEMLAEDMSRYGVMKHLGILEEADLLLVRRKGRQRFNHLNAVPLQRVYRRWVRPLAGQWSASLLNLESIVEQKSGAGTMTLNSGNEDMRAFHIEQELTIAAPRERVWKAITEEVGQWWAFRLEEGVNSDLKLEAKVGGQFLEYWGTDGEGHLWGTVTSLRKGKHLRLTGPLGMGGRPVNSLYGYELSDCEGGTRIQITHETFGHMSAEAGAHHEGGWQMLFDKYLRAYLEQGKTAADIRATEGA